ncbi:hypothetical protein Q4603_14030 [Zobellia galactanivorans]|uniref:Conserved hypothetical lipoprotein n=1 Tax=Zobellia galactanivorans (strain DSM 12802 / CCUG 47099 / CIP 106680 / NCIMB 13871 / Dsij) TaxID=63186 RepID=G0L135_ZOBGA|nr:MULTISPECIES: hypothetical protein [Zobellia]MDO6809739.1 hypothetical protein [Zobellia galactanivorans]OWW23711.1 hypothetical protein B4Q04_19430 [Zobellia sp. OII3]CAZ97615.1 Conserved hypothetical lipoprotein [Zobellia galactanivorans]
MKKLSILLLVLFVSCSSTSLVENWKNPDIVLFDAQKVLIVGMTQNENARERFETKLQKEFDKRNVEAMRSLDVFDVSFTDSKKTEKELDDVEQSLLDKDFDAILFTKVTGSENRESFLRTLAKLDNYKGRFNDDYLRNQDIYYDDDYYEKFDVYHAETTLYCICEGKDRSMIWRGSIDVTDPTNIEKTVDDYIKLIVLAMEEQDLIFRKEK